MATDPSRVLMRQLLGAVAQYDKAQIVAKLRGARLRQRAAKGRCEGRKPFGYYEGETETVTRMRALRAQGLSYHRIAATLDDEQRCPRSGVRWYAFSVQKILNREESQAHV